MTLDTYLDGTGAKSLTALSIEIGISKGRLSQLRHSTDWPPELAMKIENATDGKLNASELSPVIAQARKAAA
jgi:DNA-binding transcriptional regulator YdaS (Cro superfamily)